MAFLGARFGSLGFFRLLRIGKRGGTVCLGDAPQPSCAQDCRIASDGDAGVDVADDTTLGRDARAIAHVHVIGNADLTADENGGADSNGTREPRLRSDERACADLAVVPDVDVRVDLHASSQDRRMKGTGVDGDMAADTHVVLDDDACQVWQASKVAGRSGYESESRLSDDGVGADAHVATDDDPWREEHARVEHCIWRNAGRFVGNVGISEKLGQREPRVGVNPPGEVFELGRERCVDQEDGAAFDGGACSRNIAKREEWRERASPRAFDGFERSQNDVRDVASSRRRTKFASVPRYLIGELARRERNGHFFGAGGAVGACGCEPLGAGAPPPPPLL